MSMYAEHVFIPPFGIIKKGGSMITHAYDLRQLSYLGCESAVPLSQLLVLLYEQTVLA